MRKLFTKRNLKIGLRWLLALMMVAIGILHFVTPEQFVRIVPEILPSPLALVYVSGMFEILGGLGLLVERSRKFAGWGLVALYIAVFPANVNMAVNEIPFGSGPASPVLLWGRLPLQLVLIAWAWWMSRPDSPAPSVVDGEGGRNRPGAHEQ